MLDIKPISLKEANVYIQNNHRHHDKVQGHKFSLAVFENERLCGVAVVGRPLNRFLDNGETLEVLRLCTDGTYNACSILYARCAKIAKYMGYKKIITYILEEESGISLKASGWIMEKENVGGGNWENCQRRENDRKYIQMSLFEEKEKYPKGKKKRYVKYLRREEDE